MKRAALLAIVTSEQQLSRLPEVARTALLAHIGDDIQVKVLGVVQFTIPGELLSGDRPDEAWCAVYKRTADPGETIETEDVLLFRRGESWTVSAWDEFIDNCAIPHWTAPYWSQR